MLAIADDHGTSIWNTRGSRIATIPNAGAERGVVPLDERGGVAAISAAGTITVLDTTATGHPLARRLTAAGVGNLAYTAGGRRLATFTRAGKLRVWDTSTGHLVGPHFSTHGHARATTSHRPTNHSASTGLSPIRPKKCRPCRICETYSLENSASPSC